MSGLVANTRYLRKDLGDINLNGLRLYNVGSYTNADQLITALVLQQKSYSSYIFGQVKGNTVFVSNHSLFLDNIYTFQNGRHLNILLFLFKLTLDASFLSLKFKRIFYLERGKKGQFVCA